MGCGCGCSTKAAALRGDPAARKLVALQVDGGEIGKILPTVVWSPGQVNEYKARLDASFVPMNIAISTCAALPQLERAAWAAEYETWRQFRAKETGWWGLSNEWDACERFEARLKSWQEQVETRCTLPVPKLQGPDTDMPDLSAVKWAAAAVIAVAVVYGVRSVL